MKTFKCPLCNKPMDELPKRTVQHPDTSCTIFIDYACYPCKIILEQIEKI